MAEPQPDEDEEPDPEDPADPDVEKGKAYNQPKHTIESVSAMSDEELHHLMGHKQQMAEARKGLEEASKLTGKARQHAEDRIHEILTPRIYGGEFKYLASDAMDKVKRETGKEALANDSPSSVL